MSGKPQVLLADDDGVLLDLMLRRLQRMELEVDRARDGREGISMVNQKRYALIVTDIYMPGATGLELLEAAKQRDARTQVLVITGGATIDMALKALEAGAFAYLTKPFDHLRVFDHTVAQALRMHTLITNPQSVGAAGGGLEDEGDDSSGDRELEALRKRQHEWPELFGALPMGVMVLDGMGKMLLCNSAGERLISKAWPSKAEAVRDLMERLGRSQDQSRLTFVVRGLTMNLYASEIGGNNGARRLILILQEAASAGPAAAVQMSAPLRILKQGLSWLYQQRLREVEFRVIRDLALQVSALEGLREGLAAVIAAPSEELQASTTKEDLRPEAAAHRLAPTTTTLTWPKPRE